MRENIRHISILAILPLTFAIDDRTEREREREREEYFLLTNLFKDNYGRAMLIDTNLRFLWKTIS
jgi:hypothetical protein